MNVPAAHCQLQITSPPVATSRQRLDEMRGDLVVSGIDTTITRDYGHTAKERSDELLFHFALGILVDDAIVVVENIPRHFGMGWGRRDELSTVGGGRA